MELIDSFLLLEEELDMFSKRYKGFQYWPYIRVEIFESIQFAANESAFKKTTISTKQVISNLRKIIFNREYRIRAKNKCNVLFFCHPRRVLDSDSGYYESIYTDIYANNITDALTIESPYEGSHLIPCKTDNILYLDRLFYCRAIFSKIYSRIIKNEDKLFEEISIFVDNFQRDFDINLDCPHLVRRVIFYYSRYIFTKRYLSNLLNKVQPKIIIEVVYYNFEVMVLNEIAKEKNIKTIELQHGLTGDNHIAYNFSHKAYFNALPSVHCSFSNYWSELIRLPKSVKVEVTGFYYYEAQIKKYRKKVNPDSIIFLSSRTVGKRMASLAKSLLEDIDRLGIEYKIIFKLHPGEYADWKELYPQLVDTKIEVVDNANTNLYELFSSSIAQVGSYSTAVFEGLGYDLATFLLNGPELLFMKKLIQNNNALVIDNSGQILDGINNFRNKISNHEHYWANNSYDKTMSLIRNIEKEFIP